jgi:hypothetical protein
MKPTEKQYPIYFMELKDGEIQYGLNDVALVDKPAYETMFLKFKDDTANIKFAVQNEEERIINGPVMIPDKLVARMENGQPFFVAATRETIFAASQKFARENRNNNIKLTHDTENNTEDVFIFQSFVTDERWIDKVVGFEDQPLGTWYITCKVLSDKVWEQIKAGTFNGFSLEALFKMKPVTVLNESDLKQVLEAIG